MSSESSSGRRGAHTLRPSGSPGMYHPFDFFENNIKLGQLVVRNDKSLSRIFGKVN